MSVNYANLCRLCAQETSYGMISVEGKLKVEESETVQLRFLISYCLDIDVTGYMTVTICHECIERLKFIYSFKNFCKRNNETFFIPSTSIQELEVEPQTVQYNVKPEPVEDAHVIQEELDEFIVEAHLTDETDDRKILEMRKNAERQRQKRANETPEEREVRTRKATEQTKRRRYYLKEHCPEEYAKRLARVAEQRRIKRHNMSPEERAIERAREAAAVRLRRQNMTPEQKERIRQRNREAARLRRGSSLSLSHSDCSNSGPIGNMFIES